MQIICISRGTFGGGKQFAEKLAANLGFECLSRESLCDLATKKGIQVGKLEMNVVKRRPLNEHLAIEKERFKAFVKATLCERALKHAGLVYHGRTGYLELLDITNIMRIRVIMDPEMRVKLTMQRFGVSREKAVKYNAQVDEDRHRWVRTLYNVSWEDPENYDVVINLSSIGINNAASALVSLVGLPEFQVTPVIHKAIKNLHLSSICRLALGADNRTRHIDVKVRAEQGTVSVTYLPRRRQEAKIIPDVLSKIEGVEKTICTMASTNLLWIQERYDPKSSDLTQIIEIATKWNAAVELIKLDGSNILVTSNDSEKSNLSAAMNFDAQENEDNGGILDDVPDVTSEPDDKNLKETVDLLISAGRAGGYHHIVGGREELLKSLDKTVPYSLIVVGNLFLSKKESARTRLQRELINYLSENMRVPVLGNDELATQYLFGPKHWLKLILFGAIVASTLTWVFTHQIEILTFFSHDGTAHRVLCVAILFGIVPCFAYIYGNFTHFLLRLLKFE